MTRKSAAFNVVRSPTTLGTTRIQSEFGSAILDTKSANTASSLARTLFSIPRHFGFWVSLVQRVSSFSEPSQQPIFMPILYCSSWAAISMKHFVFNYSQVLNVYLCLSASNLLFLFSAIGCFSLAPRSHSFYSTLVFYFLATQNFKAITYGQVRSS